MSFNITLAVPSSTVERYREWCLHPDNKPSDEIRKIIEAHFENGWTFKEVLSDRFGRSGFGIPFMASGGEQFWLLCNEDTKTNQDYVAVTIYNDDMFKKRQSGEFYKIPTKVAESKPVIPVDDHHEGAVYRVEWFPEPANDMDVGDTQTALDEEFKSAAEASAFVEKLMGQDIPIRDISVWQKCGPKVRVSV